MCVYICVYACTCIRDLAVSNSLPMSPLSPSHSQYQLILVSRTALTRNANLHTCCSYSSREHGARDSSIRKTQPIFNLRTHTLLIPRHYQVVSLTLEKKKEEELVSRLYNLQFYQCLCFSLDVACLKRRKSPPQPNDVLLDHVFGFV